MSSFLSYVQCYPCLSFLVGSVSSFCVLYLMISVFIFLSLVSNVTRVYPFLWVRVFFLCLMSNVTRVYLFWWGSCLLSVSCAQCYPCISFLIGFVSSFCVLCLMVLVSIFLCLVSNVTRVYLFWWGPCLSFSVLCPMLPVSIFFDGVCVFFLCIVSNVLHVYLFW